MIGIELNGGIGTGLYEPPLSELMWEAPCCFDGVRNLHINLNGIYVTAFIIGQSHAQRTRHENGFAKKQAA